MVVALNILVASLGISCHCLLCEFLAVLAAVDKKKKKKELDFDFSRNYLWPYILLPIE